MARKKSRLLDDVLEYIRENEPYGVRANEIRSLYPRASDEWLSSQKELWFNGDTLWHVAECPDCGSEKRDGGECKECRQSEIEAELASYKTEDLEREIRRRKSEIRRMFRESK